MRNGQWGVLPGTPQLAKINFYDIWYQPNTEIEKSLGTTRNSQIAGGSPVCEGRVAPHNETTSILIKKLCYIILGFS